VPWSLTRLGFDLRRFEDPQIGLKKGENTSTVKLGYNNHGYNNHGYNNHGYNNHD
jgi:hypothetical protein